jgi:AcrR family transcriptional regulator
MRLSQRSHEGGRLRDRLREEASRAILEAAEQVFSEVGLSARMEAIADRAGVAVGTLYNHFEDRRALIDALADSRRGSLVARLDAALDAAEGLPAREQLTAFLSAVTEHAKQHGRLLTALVQAGEGPARVKPPPGILDVFTARAERLVGRMVETGVLRAEGAELHATALVGMIRAGLVRAIEGTATWEKVSSCVLEMFLRGTSR